jgi:choline dehydrogenase-like flavoprotein
MSTEQDWQEFRDAIRITREIMQQPALDPYRGEEISPEKMCSTDAELTNLCVIMLKQLIIHPVVVKWVKMIWR